MTVPGQVALAQATPATPPAAPVNDPSPAANMGEVALAQAKGTTPVTAPVNDPPLPPVLKAGVYLTWGVLSLITVFLFLMMVYLWTKEPLSGLSPTAVVSDTVAFRLRSADQAAFRDFWLKILQMVLLNVLLPVLTALLGYVFATQRERTAKEQ